MSIEWVTHRAAINSTFYAPHPRAYHLEADASEPYHTRGASRASPPIVDPLDKEESPGASLGTAAMPALDQARYMRDVQRQRPIPVCDPQHLYVSARHRDGYIDRQGRRHPGCKSPGKAPLVPQWQRFSSQPPTDDELRAMFANHTGNIGNVVLDGRVVLDVDKRSGGLATLKLLQGVYEALPETPAQRTGGGGYHYHFLLPTNVSLPAAGGSLASLGYPGIEWKGPTQQVIVAPSTYPGTGAAYEWVEGAALEDVEVAPIPEWLLALIIQVNQTPKPRKATELNPVQEGGLQKRAPLTHAEIVMAFRQMYPEGSRRAGTGLPRLVGIFMGRGVDVDLAVPWFQSWQQTHFEPPLSDADIEYTVRDIYWRYRKNEQRAKTQGTEGYGEGGRVQSKPNFEVRRVDKGGANLDLHGAIRPSPKANRAVRRSARAAHDTRGRAFLIRLSKEIAGKAGMRTDSPVLAPTGEAITQEEAFALTRRAIAEMRNDALFSQRRGAQNRHLDTIVSSEMQVPILLAERRYILSKDELYDKLAFAEGPDAKILERLEHCLWDGAMTCWEHGDQFETRCMCRLFVHYDCIHQSTLKVRQLNLPDIPKDQGCYISLRMQWTTPVYTDINPETGHQSTSVFLGMEREDFQHEIRKLGQRKRGKLGGTILGHSMGFLLARPEVIVEGRVLFRLDGTDRRGFDAAIAQLCKRLGGRITGERVYQEGESVVVQLMEDSMSGFLGMKDRTDNELFAAMYWELKGKTLFQGLGELYQMLREVEKEEPALCPVCQRVLRLRPISPEETLEKKRAGGPAQTSATPPSPPPKQARLVV